MSTCKSWEHVVVKSGAKIKGRFCERILKPKGHFAPASFRWVKSRHGWLMFGCPVAKWNGTSCKGMRLHAQLTKVRR